MADWDSLSIEYDSIFLENPHYVRTLRQMVELIDDGFDGCILDLGCGTGNLIAALLIRFPQANIFGVDPSAGMLEKCEKRFSENQNVRFSSGNALKIPFPDNHFACMMSNLALHHLPPENRSSCAAELARVLKSGGRLIYADIFCGIDGPPDDPRRHVDIVNKSMNEATYCLEHGAHDMALLIIEALPAQIRAEGEYEATERLWIKTLRSAGFTGLNAIPVPPIDCGIAIILGNKAGASS